MQATNRRQVAVLGYKNVGREREREIEIEKVKRVPKKFNTPCGLFGAARESFALSFCLSSFHIQQPCSCR